MKIKVQAEPFDAGAEIAALHAGNPAVGAVTSFTGYCRDEGGQLEAMELEHFPGMAEEALMEIAKQADTRWPLIGITIIHRHGRLEPGAPIVLVATASAHRRASFEAADFLMDFLKTKAPFWKKEHPANPEDKARWVEAKASDDADTERWASKS
jgi:molybdopterin synthase catalytic subunit